MPRTTRTIPFELLEHLAHPSTILRASRLDPDETFLGCAPQRPSFFDEFWSVEADRKLIRLLRTCGTLAVNYLFDVFYGDFVHLEERFAATLRRGRWPVPPDEGMRQFYHRLSDYLFGVAGDLLRSGRVEMVNRVRRCTLSGEEFDDTDFGASISFHRRRIPKVEALGYWLDIHPRRLDAFRRIGDPEDVLASVADYGKLIDELGFYPLEGSSELVLLANGPRARFPEVISRMERCFFPSRYADVLGGHVAALFATGCLGPTPVVRGTLGYRAVAEDGHVCHSLAEKLIDDWLHRNGIPHEKEPPYPDAVRALCGGRVRADWQVGDVFVEYFGLQTDPDYARKTEAKLAACRATGVHVLALYPGDEMRPASALSELLGTGRA